MESQALVIGRSYAYREKRSPACPLLKVKLLDKVGRKGKLKIRFEDGPHPGLEEYVSSRQLVVPWGERRALLRDEERAARLEEHARDLADKALTEAASAVLESTGEPGAYAGETTTWMRENELQRILDRAGVQTPPADLHPFAYRDRHANIHLPLDAVVALARAFAAAEPQTVIGYLTDREEELRLKGNLPGERWYHEYLASSPPDSHWPGSGRASSRRARCCAKRLPGSADCSQEQRTTSRAPGRSAKPAGFCERWRAAEQASPPRAGPTRSSLSIAGCRPTGAAGRERSEAPPLEPAHTGRGRSGTHR